MSAEKTVSERIITILDSLFLGKDKLAGVDKISAIDGLDSLADVEAAQRIEDEFGIKFERSILSFMTINEIAKYVEEKLALKR
ncbi:MAG TPA: acyl carrier protein [Candidatus Methylomirabilis sp.]|nr:acyl carrier protein [Candidatus Methylomirabilis sp.]